MPIYEYRCTACQERFTRQQSIAEHSREASAPPPRCPKCGSPAVVPVFSPFFAKTVRKS